jgi:hypothetical protein
MAINYWLDLFTYQTWTEFLKAGGEVSGFRQRRWNTVKQMKPGDILLCYLTGVGRWIGLLEVVGEPFQDTTPIWKLDDFPARVPVKIVAKLEPMTAVPVLEMRDVLSVFRDLKSPHAWTGHFRGSPARWKTSDGQAVVTAVNGALAQPVERPFDPAKLKKVPPTLKAPKGGSVVIPDDEEEETQAQVTPAIVAGATSESEQKAATVHTEIQWLLLKLGGDMGLDVWVAKNDRNRNFNGQSFGSVQKLKQKLPLQFDEATTRTIELIDVLWLRGNSIQAAFEIESTTSIFSGLLRMSDLITMQPNLNIPLYIVAPSERRSKVMIEVNRPTFASLTPPMSEVCRFIAFETLQARLNLAKDFLQFLKPEFLDAISEGTEIEEV